jgi:hypothetical protein
MDYVVHWYGANSHARTIGDVPTIYVWFRLLFRDGQFGGLVYQRMASTFLGQLRIGSIWRNGISTHELEFDEFKFNVLYKRSNWDDVVWMQKHPGLIPADSYPLPYNGNDQSRLLRFHSDGKTLLVPCMEFFSRCYAHSAEVNRVLLTYGTPELEDRLMLSEPIPSLSDTRQIWIPPITTDADAHLLARMRYDEEMSKRLRAFSAQLDQELMASKRSLAFLTFGPWHYGLATLKVQGMNLGNGNFLALRIVGHTLPEDYPVHALRLHKETDTESELAHFPKLRREIHEVPEDQTLAVTQESMADQDTCTNVIKDPGIEILNTPAPVTTETVRRDRNGRTTRIPPAPSSDSAPGEIGGTGKGVASLHVHSQPTKPSEGAVLQLWAGLLYLQEANPGLIDSVGCCTPSYTFQGPPAVPKPSFRLPNIKFFRSVEDNKKTRLWLHRPGLSSARSVFIFQIKTANYTGYIFEVQRAVRQIEGKSGEKKTKEDNYCGLVAVPKDGCDLKSWFDTVLEVISWKCGIMKEVRPHIKHVTSHQSYYPRSQRDGDTLEGQATAFRALTKLGLLDLNYSK